MYIQCKKKRTKIGKIIFSDKLIFFRYCQRDKESLEVQYSENSYRQDVAGPDNKSSACEGEGSDEEEGEDEEDAEIDDDDDDEEEDSIDFVEAAHPVASKKRRSKAFKLGKLKASCKPEELQKLKLQCEVCQKFISIPYTFSSKYNSRNVFQKKKLSAVQKYILFIIFIKK